MNIGTRRFGTVAAKALAVTVLAAAPLTITGQAQAAATAKPRVGWYFSSSQVDQGASVRIVWSATGTPRGARLLLQRTTGTANRWINVTYLRTLKGSTTTKAPIRGAYSYRIVVLDVKRKVLASSAHVLRSYANVTLGQVMSRNTSTVQVNGTLFRYVQSYGSGTYTFLRLDSTSCRSAKFQLAKDGTAGNTGTLSIVQESADLQVGTVTAVGTAPFNATLSGDAVDFQLTDPGSDNGYVYVDGFLSCYTADGRR